MAPVLAYWDIRGLAQPIRLLLAYLDIEFEDKYYVCGPAPDFDKSCWFDVKHTLGFDFPNLPYYIDGDVKLTQSNAILRYIGEKHNLLGTTEKERIRVNLMENEIGDFRSAWVGLCYNPEFEKLKDSYHKNLPQKLAALSKFLGEKSWLAGENITIVDFIFYEMLDQHLLFDEKCLDEFANLKNYHKRFQALDKIQAYMKVEGDVVRLVAADVVAIETTNEIQMSRSAPLKLSVELNFSSVTCPSIRLDPLKWVKLRLCLLGFHLSTRAVRAHFPLEFDEKMLVERTFPLCNTPMHLFSTLLGEKLIVELIELSQEPRVLAAFGNDVIDLLFGSPPIMRINETRNHYLTIILNTTHHLAGHMNLHLDATINVTLFQVVEAIASSAQDEALNLTLGLYATEHPNYMVPYQNPLDRWRTSHYACKRDLPPRPCQRMAVSSRKSPAHSPKRQPFVVRHVDDKLIGRTPSGAANGTHALDHGYTLGRTLKPWQTSLHRSTSQVDTHSSLLRRRSRINKPVTRLVFPEESGSDWCISDPRSDRFTGESRYRHSSPPPQVPPISCCLEDPDQQSVDTTGVGDFHCLCRNYHDSLLCTVCQLYQQYFGQPYPKHRL